MLEVVWITHRIATFIRINPRCHASFPTFKVSGITGRGLGGSIAANL
jgi:hypothetical protein